MKPARTSTDIAAAKAAIQKWTIERDKRIVRMRDQDGMTFRDIAAALGGISHQRVAQIYTRAKRQA